MKHCVILMAAMLAFGALATDYNITLATDSSPDLTDIDSYLNSITSQYSTPQEQAIAIWRWSQRLRKQNTNPMREGMYVLDPIELFNSYGYCNCGIISGVNNALWLKMGWKAHYVQLGDHTVCECSWDGGKSWHMFDASMSFYCFNEKGEVASVREIEQNPKFYLENFAPECGTNPAKDINDHRAWRCASDRPVENQRTLANGYDSFKPPNSIQTGNLYAQYGRRYVLNLRPNESYTRYFEPMPSAGTTTFRPVGNGEDPDTYKYIRANGVWHYAPDLRDPATRESVYAESGVIWAKDGVRPKAGEPAAFVIFKLNAANAITSATLAWEGRDTGVSFSRDCGMHWESVELLPERLSIRSANLPEKALGVTEILIKAELNAPDAALNRMTITALTQLNRPALPKLVLGPNRVQVRLGPQVETIQFAPSIANGNHTKTAFAESSIDVEKQPDFYKPTLRPAENKTPCSVTWKIEAPTPITDLVYGGTVCVKSPRDRVTLLHSWDDKAYSRDFQKADGAEPFDLMVNTPVANVPDGTRTAYLRYEFETEQQAKSYAGPGIQMAQMLVHHQPRDAKFVPIEVTYCWIEHRESGDVERQHTELVTTPAYEYSVNVGGFRDPTMKWVRMKLKDKNEKLKMQNTKLENAAATKYGYSDGEDVGAGAKVPWARYKWGTNLALGKIYTLEGKQNAKNPDGGGDLTDGIIAPPDTYVSVKWMPTNVIFEKDESPRVTIDVGAVQNVAAVRVQAGQAGDFHLTFPEKITVETSADGNAFTAVGTVGFNQVFEPPADYAPWELDQSLLYKDLPAGGRLAYAYRVIFDKPVSARYVRVKCDARKGWGIMLSEVQVFDAVAVDKNPPLAVVHPAVEIKN